MRINLYYRNEEAPPSWLPRELADIAVSKFREETPTTFARFREETGLDEGVSIKEFGKYFEEGGLSQYIRRTLNVALRVDDEGKMDGFGVSKTFDGTKGRPDSLTFIDIYVGEWKHGERHGKGVSRYL